MGVRKHNCPACGRSDGHGTGLPNWYSVCGTMVHVMVFSTNKVESNIGKARYNNRKIPRSCERGDCARDLETFSREAHTEVVHVDNCGKSFVKDRWKPGHEQGVGRMGHGR